jgi:hypothetical protein
LLSAEFYAILPSDHIESGDGIIKETHQKDRSEKKLPPLVSEVTAVL